MLKIFIAKSMNTGRVRKFFKNLSKVSYCGSRNRGDLHHTTSFGKFTFGIALFLLSPSTGFTDQANVTPIPTEVPPTFAQTPSITAIPDGPQVVPSVFPEGDQGFMDVVPMTDQVAGRIMESIFNDEMLDLPKDELPPPAQGIGMVWGGSYVKAKADLRFRLSIKPRSSARGTIRHDFTLSFAFPKEAFILVHSSPRDPGQRGGIRLAYSRQKTQKYFLEGAGDTGLVVIAPRFAEDDFRGAVLCPRKYPVQPDENLILVDTDYKPGEGFFQIDASATGKTTTGKSIGFAKAIIRATRNIVPSNPFIDQIYSIAPEADIFYIPHESIKPLPLTEDQQIIGGGMASIELKQPNGNRRYQTARDIIWVKEVTIQKTIPMKVAIGSLLDSPYAQIVREKFGLGNGVPRNPQAGVDVGVSPGNCFIILNLKTVRNGYTKEDPVPQDGKQLSSPRIQPIQ